MELKNMKHFSSRVSFCRNQETLISHTYIFEMKTAHTSHRYELGMSQFLCSFLYSRHCDFLLRKIREACYLMEGCKVRWKAHTRFSSLSVCVSHSESVFHFESQGSDCYVYRKGFFNGSLSDIVCTYWFYLSVSSRYGPIGRMS